MMNTPTFFPALMAALQFGEPKPEGLRQLSDSDWHELLAFSDRAHLTLPLILRNKQSVPAWVWHRAGTNLADNRKRRQRIAASYQEIASAFSREHIQHLVIKGFAQYPDFISALDTRMQSDIDIYCPREAIRSAQQALWKIGYASDRTLEGYPADHVPAMSRPGNWLWRGNYYDPEMPTGVDLHFCLWNEGLTRVSVNGLQGFWGRRVLRESAGFWFPSLATVDNLAFSALHIVRDLMRGDAVLHRVYEMACFLDKRAEDDLFWEEWLQTHPEQLRSMQAISFSLAREWFGCRCGVVAEDEIARLAEPVAQWLKKFSSSPLTGMFTPNKHGLWLHLALLNGTHDKFQIMQSTLLPLRLPHVGATAQSTTRIAALKRFWPTQRHLRYVLHVCLRFTYHLRLIPGTLWRGLEWRYAQRRA
jgi:hypothetical protein